MFPGLCRRSASIVAFLCIRGCESVAVVGKPILPCKVRRILIPTQAADTRTAIHRQTLYDLNDFLIFISREPIGSLKKSS